MTTTARRSRAPHLGPARRRPHVLDAALLIALDTGIGAVTIGAVATRMGVTRPVVYSCFADRVELVNALLDRESRALEASMLDALRSTSGISDPEEAFVRGFQALLASADALPDAWRLLLVGEPDPAVSMRFQAAKASVRQQATTWITAATRNWWHTTDLDRKIPVLMDFFMASCESAVRALIIEGSTWQPAELGDFMGRAVFRAFRDA